ncbi:MAG: RNA methyltransferase [Acidobacteria bacterium]|nr:RNA methyltransferase [Acidobacteriota bacterium]MCA1651876.1 RNA methyltransferase [Acidobacteriota bacterium]
MKRFRELARGSEEHLLLDGEHLLAEAIACALPVEVAAFSDRAVEARLASLAAVAERAGVRTITVSDSILSVMSPVQQPSGVVAIAARRPASLDEILAVAPQLVLMLSGVQDPGNAGAIVRAADGCGATGIITGEGTADPFGWKALRGAMGSTFRLPVSTPQPLASAIRRAHASRLHVLATVPRGGTSLPEADLRGPVAILLGGEGAGLPAELVSLADGSITIPMRHAVESLNVAVSAALIVYEAARQRGAHVLVR